jgi:hypothetical protein
VNQGDAIFMSGQHRAVGRTADQPGKHDYFLPSDADKGTAMWIRWLEVPIPLSPSGCIFVVIGP